MSFCQLWQKSSKFGQPLLVMENDLGNLHQSEIINKLNILNEKTFTSKVSKENKD